MMQFCSCPSHVNVLVVHEGFYGLWSSPKSPPNSKNVVTTCQRQKVFAKWVQNPQNELFLTRNKWFNENVQDTFQSTTTARPKKRHPGNKRTKLPT